MNYSDEVKAFCQNIKYLRTIKQLSQADMARMLGISVSTLRLVERGILPSRLMIDVIFKIEANFDIPPHDVFDKNFSRGR